MTQTTRTYVGSVSLKKGQSHSRKGNGSVSIKLISFYALAKASAPPTISRISVVMAA